MLVGWAGMDSWFRQKWAAVIWVGTVNQGAPFEFAVLARQGSRGLYPSVPVEVVPVDAIAGVLGLGDVPDPPLVDLVVDVGFSVSKAGFRPFLLN